MAFGALLLLVAPSILIAQNSDESTSAANAAPVPAARQAEKVVAITIRGPIDKWTSYSVQRRLEAAERLGASAIVIDLDTPGGEIGAVLEICNALKGSTIPNTVAWVNRQAYSGGAIIALACKEIVVNDPSTMGDAAPIAVSPISGLQNLGETEREKLLRPLLTELIDSARRHGYDELLVQAFVATGVELWMVEDVDTGQRIFIDEREYAMLFDDEPPRSRISLDGADQRPAPADATSSGDADGAVRIATEGATPELTKGVSEDLEYKGSSSKRPVISGADKGDYRLIGYAWDGGLLTLTTQDLQRYGFAERIVKNDEELKQFFGAKELERLNRTWSESLARFLDSFVVKGFLVVIFLLALFMEMAAPGIGLAGGVAVFCLAALVAPQFLVGAASWWGIAAVLTGLLLIGVEIFIVPGFGIPGIAGVIALLLGLLGLIVGPGGFSGPGAAEDIVYGAATLLLAFFTAGVGMYFISKHYRSFPLFNRLVLVDHVGGAASDVGLLGAMSTSDSSAVKVGDIGVATTTLRPAGTAEFNDELVDVVSEFGFVETGAPVRVTSVGRFRVAVEPVRDDAEPQA